MLEKLERVHAVKQDPRFRKTSGFLDRAIKLQKLEPAKFSTSLFHSLKTKLPLPQEPFPNCMLEFSEEASKAWDSYTRKDLIEAGLGQLSNHRKNIVFMVFYSFKMMGGRGSDSMGELIEQTAKKQADALALQALHEFWEKKMGEKEAFNALQQYWPTVEAIQKKQDEGLIVQASDFTRILPQPASTLQAAQMDYYGNASLIARRWAFGFNPNITP